MSLPDQPPYRRHVLDPLGLVAGMFDALGLGDVIDHATPQNPAMRDLTVGEAVNAMVLNGLGCIKQALYLVPRFFPTTPTSRLISPRVVPEQLNCFLLATNELDTTQLPPQAVLAGEKDQVQVERGFRWLKDPQFLASSLYLKKPERLMALLMVLTLCLLVEAALEYRIRQVLNDHAATFPDHQGQRTHQPTARWGLHCFVGMPWRG